MVSNCVTITNESLKSDNVHVSFEFEAIHFEHARPFVLAIASTGYVLSGYIYDNV